MAISSICHIHVQSVIARGRVKQQTPIECIVNGILRFTRPLTKRTVCKVAQHWRLHSCRKQANYHSVYETNMVQQHYQQRK